MESDTASRSDALHELFVAVDGGPRAVLAPLAARCGRRLYDVSSGAAETAAYWSRAIDSNGAALLVVGTSDSARGRRVEGAARRAAHRARISIVAIEDFPGNYYDVSGGEATLVMVESIAARDICLRKLGARAPEVEIAISARYDIYRDRLDELRRNTSASWARAQRLVVLWAGQPETDDCMLTLAALLPSFQSNDVDLLFKAHPRDPAYGSGAYHALLKTAGIRAIDVTGSTVDEALSAAPNLAVTQFSSVAIEAGFFGIPSLWVLLPDAGGARLEQKKGYAVPPLCLAQGAACATNTESLPTAFGQAVADTDYRLNLMQCFDDYFKVRQRGTPAVLSKLRQLQRDAK